MPFEVCELFVPFVTEHMLSVPLKVLCIYLSYFYYLNKDVVHQVITNHWYCSNRDKLNARQSLTLC